MLIEYWWLWLVFASVIFGAILLCAKILKNINALEREMNDLDEKIKATNAEARSLIHEIIEVDNKIAALESEASSLRAQVSQLTDGLFNKVDANQIIAQINQSAEDIRIKGSLIEIDSNTNIENGVIATASVDSKEIAKLVERHQRNRRRF